MRGKMDCHGQTDPGRVLEVNQDQFLIADLNKSMLIHQTSLSHEDHTRLFGGTQGQLLLVADGTGKDAQGKRASTIAVETLARYVLNTMPWFLAFREGREARIKEELRSALEECQKSVEAAAGADPQRGGMGTTLTMAYLHWPSLHVVHAGDSRCYLLRGGRLEQVTTDHSLAPEMLVGEEARGPRWSDVLWNRIGGGAYDLNPDVYRATLQVGDTLLLCTDGLTRVVPDARVRDILRDDEPAGTTCRRLIDAANELGGPDNVSVVVAHFRQAGQSASHAARHAAAEEPAAVPEADAVEAGAA